MFNYIVAILCIAPVKVAHECDKSLVTLQLMNSSEILPHFTSSLTAANMNLLQRCNVVHYDDFGECIIKCPVVCCPWIKTFIQLCNIAGNIFLCTIDLKDVKHAIMPD